MGYKVTLRQKKISKGRKSLYLDIYPAIPHPETGKPTRRDFLNLYIHEKPKTPLDKQHNVETLKIGESIRQKRENFLNKPEIYNEYEREQLRLKKLGEQCFMEYARELAEKRHGSNYHIWKIALDYLETFTKGNIKVSDLNEKFFEEFKEYLLTTKSKRSNKTTLSQNSAVSYFNKVKAALRQAYKDGLIQSDLNAKIKPIKTMETRRMRLTIEELNKLVKTDCKSPVLKRASLFSALTGLRFGDIQKMTWEELEFIKGKGYCLNYIQQKTKGVEVLPVTDEAYSFTEGADNPANMPQSEKVFKGLKYSAHLNKILSEWINEAGISKEITFHCFRHTFATLLLKTGAGIYTTKEVMGHQSVSSTQVYGKIEDETKREAVNKIKLGLLN